MWQLFALASLLSTSLQNVSDKWAIVHDRRIEASVATFWRSGLIFIFTLLIGTTGWLGPIVWYFDWWIIAFALASVVSAYCYTFMLRKIEVTGIQAETYLMPLIFLAVDAVYLQAALSAAQIAGVMLLAAGGFAFAFDGKTHRLKKEFSTWVWVIYVYWMVFGGFQYYLFKFLHSTQDVNAVSFLASALFIIVALLLLAVVLRGKYKLLFNADSARYIPVVAVSKFFDTGGVLLWLTALGYAAVSQVTALGALAPLFLFVIAFVVQKETRFNIRERVDKANFRWKAAAVILVCAGMVLVS